MKKIIIIICTILVIITLVIINRNDEQILGEDYYYLPNYEAKDLGFPGGGIIYKSKRKYLYSDVKIRGNVVEVNSDNNFIIASQNTDTLYVGINNSVKSNLKYYIIIKEKDSVYGPYDLKEYLSKRLELKIPDDLNLKE